MNDWINICKLNNIEDLIPACDVAISYYLQQPEINATIIKAVNFTFIGCNYVGNKCCGNQIEIKNLISPVISFLSQDLIVSRIRNL